MREVVTIEMNTFRFTFLLVLIYSLAIQESQGQMSRDELSGYWHTINDDSSYHKIDSVTFYLDAQSWVAPSACHIVEWRIDKRKFALRTTFRCEDPGTEAKIIGKEKLLILKKNYGQILLIKRDRKVIDKFKVLSLVEVNVDGASDKIKQLKVLRFDKPNAQKLYQHVDSLVYQVLRYKPDPPDSNASNLITQNGPAGSVKIKIRDGQEVNPKPLLVINGVPMKAYDILKDFLFVEAIEISYITKDQASHLYGYRSLNGVIIINLSKRAFKSVWRKFNEE